MVSHTPTPPHKAHTRRRATTSTHVPVVRWRIYVLLVVSLLIVVRIALRLIDLQVVQHGELSAMARGEISRQITLQPDRGMIMDRYGNVLAMDVERQSLWVNPSEVSLERAPRLALTLATLLSKDSQQVLEVLTNQEMEWVRVARWLEPPVAERVAELNESGLYLVYEPRRVYPQKDFAAPIIGAVNDNGEGVSGVENFYNEQLKGITGTLKAEFDSGLNPIAIAPQQSSPALDGASLRLTIDPVVQHIAETELKNAVEAHNAEGGVIIVLEPATGAVRAMATWPTFDLNRYGDYDPDVYGRNPAISNLYEPGSTFKIITVAAGLQSRAFTADTLVSDPGVIGRYDIEIHNWNSLGNGMINPADVLYYSSNVGAVQLNELTGPEQFYSIVAQFGFGAPTGIDLAGEEQGLVRGTWSPDYNETVFLTNAYGQGIAVTPIQLAHAVAAIANDGKLMRPYVVEERCWNKTQGTDGAQQETIAGEETLVEDGEQMCVETQPEEMGQVVEPGVAWTIRRMLARSANHYAPIVWQTQTGSFADQWLVPGYEVGAKTGTASIPLPEGGYDPYHVIGSVVGIAPTEQARYVVLVKVDRPQGDAWGLATAVPAFHNIVEQLMRYERIPPNPVLTSPGQS